MKLVIGLFTAAAVFAQVQDSGTTAGLRGVSAVSEKVVWASGTGGTYLRTLDGGTTWTAAKVPGAADLDFRAVRAFDEKNAYLLSIGNGEKSRIYQTTDGGNRWQLLYTNPDPKGFWDALAFWDETHGIVLGDPVDGRFTILTTRDGGTTWQTRKGPSAVSNEGAFAASNSCLVVRGAREAWFGTGGPNGARIFHSTDGGETWSVAKTPIRNDGASAGVFAVAFSEGGRGIAVGGDYNKFKETVGLIATSTDQGKTWVATKGAPAGFRSDVKNVSGTWVVAGTSGADFSTDNGDSWQPLESGNFNALSFSGKTGWAVGPKGVIVKLTLK